jgi:hypothetical protein
MLRGEQTQQPPDDEQLLFSGIAQLRRDLGLDR